MKNEPETDLTIHFRYKKAVSYRNFHVDGIYGGLTNRGFLHMDFFVEKNPIPDREVCSLKNNNQLEVTDKRGDNSIIREIEGGLIMDYNMMKSMREWLDGKIRFFEDNFVASKNPTHKD